MKQTYSVRKKGFIALLTVISMFFSIFHEFGLTTYAEASLVDEIVITNEQFEANSRTGDYSSHYGKVIKPDGKITGKQYGSGDTKFIYVVDSGHKYTEDAGINYGASYDLNTNFTGISPELKALLDSELYGWEVVSIKNDDSGGQYWVDSIELSAVYKSHKINYVLYGGTNSASNPTSYTYGTSLASLADPTKDGYNFEGWYTDAAMTNPVTSPAIGTTDSGEKTFYAKFTPNEYKISYVLDGGTNASTNPSKYTCGDEITKLAEPTKDGYDFKGWYTDAAMTSAVSSPVIGKTDFGDKTYYAKFTLKQKEKTKEPVVTNETPVTTVTTVTTGTTTETLTTESSTTTEEKTNKEVEKSPKTGDNTPVSVMIFVLLISGLGIVFISLIGRKRRY